MDSTYVFGYLLALIVSGIIGALIGRNHKIGAGWAFALSFFLSIIGWIIAGRSRDKDAPPKELPKAGKILLLVFGCLFLASGLFATIMALSYSQVNFILSGLSLIVLGSYLLHCTRKEQPNAVESGATDTTQEETKVDEQIPKVEDNTRFMPPAMREKILTEQNKGNTGSEEIGKPLENCSEPKTPVAVNEIEDGKASGEIKQQNDSAQDNKRECDIELAYCRHCGEKIEADSTFCKYCGKQLLNKKS